ncbi:hypothetical protein Tco_0508160 [Tanacetum coccineum]
MNKENSYSGEQRKLLFRAVNKGMHDGLVAGIEHGKAGRALSDKDASIADIMDSLRLEGPDTGELQPSYEQLMLPIHRTKDNVVLGENSLSFYLEVIHNRIQRIMGDVEARRLSLSDAMVPLIEPLSSKNLLVSVPLLSVADYEVVHVGPQVEDPSSGGIVFEKEELETSPESAMGSKTSRYGSASYR